MNNDKKIEKLKILSQRVAILVFAVAVPNTSFAQSINPWNNSQAATQPNTPPIYLAPSNNLPVWANGNSAPDVYAAPNLQNQIGRPQTPMQHPSNFQQMPNAQYNQGQMPRGYGAQYAPNGYGQYNGNGGQYAPMVTGQYNGYGGQFAPNGYGQYNGYGGQFAPNGYGQPYGGYGPQYAPNGYGQFYGNGGQYAPNGYGQYNGYGGSIRAQWLRTI